MSKCIYIKLPCFLLIFDVPILRPASHQSYCSEALHRKAPSFRWLKTSSIIIRFSLW